MIVNKVEKLLNYFSGNSVAQKTNQLSGYRYYNSKAICRRIIKMEQKIQYPPDALEGRKRPL